MSDVDLDWPKAHAPEPMSGGVVVFRDGRTFYSFIVGRDSDGDYEVRYENGWYAGYTRDGLKCELKEVDGKKRWVRSPDAGENGSDIVRFVRTNKAELDGKKVPVNWYGGVA